MFFNWTKIAIFRINTWESPGNLSKKGAAGAVSSLPYIAGTVRQSVSRAQRALRSVCSQPSNAIGERERLEQRLDPLEELPVAGSFGLQLTDLLPVLASTGRSNRIDERPSG